MDRQLKRDKIKGTDTRRNEAPLGRKAAERSQNKNIAKDENEQKRRRRVPTACAACRKRRSKCDGAHPACAACVSVYNTECVYDLGNDRHRKDVPKKDNNNVKTTSPTLETIIQAILHYPEEEVPELVRKIRTWESLDKVAETVVSRENDEEGLYEPIDAPAEPAAANFQNTPSFESRLSSKVGELRLDHGAVRVVGGTSNLIFLEEEPHVPGNVPPAGDYFQPEDPVTSWTGSTTDPYLVNHLLNLYFTWHWTFFTILPKDAFYSHFLIGRPRPGAQRRMDYCTCLLVNAMLALGSHFTSNPAARSDPDDSATAGDNFFREAKRRLYEDDELATPKLATVQALALMSLREAGCAREANGWVYSGMAFRMACDLGLSFHSNLPSLISNPSPAYTDEEEDARRITFWGCFIIDKCWSQYLGRLPIFELSTNITIPKFDVFPNEEASHWLPYSDSGFVQAKSQPSRTRAVALQISVLCEISSDLIRYFYHPQQTGKSATKQQEMKWLSEIQSRLEAWKRDLPKELEPKEGILSSVLVMHMLFQLLYIHLFRPFLKYNQQTSPLPSNVSPRKFCTLAAETISRLLRLYKRSHGLGQIVNIAVYICHSACTIHLLNLPEHTAERDITHGVKHLEEIADSWICARRTLRVLSAQAEKWNIELPEEAATVLARTDIKFGVVFPSHSPTSTASNPRQETDPMNQASPPFYNPPAISGYHPSNQEHVVGMANSSQQNPPLLLGSHGSAVPRYPAFNPGLLPAYNGSEIPQGQTGSDSISPGIDVHERPHQQPQSEAQHPPSGAQPRKRKTDRMFGGVEALLREGHDWLMEDQSNLATGFDNWNWNWAGGRAGGPENLKRDGSEASTIGQPGVQAHDFGIAE